jgi:hypothetical protein
MLGVGVGFDTKVRIQQSNSLSYNHIVSEHHYYGTILMAGLCEISGGLGWLRRTVIDIPLCCRGIA